MYIVAIAWMFTATLLSVTQASVVAGVLTFMLWGVCPLALLLWLVGTPARRRKAAAGAAQQDAPRSPRG